MPICEYAGLSVGLVVNMCARDEWAHLYLYLFNLLNYLYPCLSSAIKPGVGGTRQQSLI